MSWSLQDGRRGTQYESDGIDESHEEHCQGDCYDCLTAYLAEPDYQDLDENLEGIE